MHPHSFLGIAVTVLLKIPLEKTLSTNMSIMAKLHSYCIIVNPAENLIENHFLCSFP